MSGAQLALVVAPAPRLLTCAFAVHGEPVPCGRPRARIVTPRGKAPFVHIYADPASSAYEKLVGAAAIAARPAHWRLDWARYEVRVRVYQSHQRGDGDNFWKAVADGCQGILWENDRRAARRGVFDVFDEFDRPRMEVLASMVGDMDIEQDRKARTRMLADRRKKGV